MKKLFKNNPWIPGIALGAVAGNLYWKNVGCINGTCAITSNPINSILYFSITGGLLFGMFQAKERLPGNDASLEKMIE